VRTGDARDTRPGADLGLARAPQEHDLGLVAYIAYRSDGKKRA